MRTVRHLLILSIIFLSYSCSQNNQTKQKEGISSIKEIEINEVTKEEIPDIMILNSFIPLSNKIPLAPIKRVLIYKERIYILDDQPKIVCFNMKGDILFKIDCKGAGPTEYLSIKDFAIDDKSERIVTLDHEKRKLFFYDLNTGKHLSNISTMHMAPTEMGVIHGCFFFKNIDRRFDIQKKQMFYLLYSKNGKQIDKMFLPHDAVADFNFDLNSFFYNDNSLLFIKPFDNIVYLLAKERITPIFKISLPNPLPIEKIEEKIKHTEMPTSGYAYGIDNIYTTESMLHFTFTKDGYIVSVFFDLITERLLYSGIRVLGNSRKQLPFYSLIDGVYKGKFYALVSASSIVERKTVQAEPFINNELLKTKEDDNPILAFFTFK